MSFAVGVAVGFAMGKKMFEGGGGVAKDIVGVVNSEGTLTVYTASIGESSFAQNVYILKSETICKITFTKVGDLTITNKWSATFITDVAKADGTVLFHANYDDHANLINIVNSEGEQIYLSEPDLSEEERQYVSYSIADGVALGYMIGANNVASEVIAKAVEAYKKGLDDTDSNAEITSGDVIIPDGAAILINEAPTSPFKTIYYGESSGEITFVDDSKVMFYLNYNIAEQYYKGELNGTFHNNSVTSTLYFENSNWKLIGDWYYRSTGEKYEGQGVYPYGTGY